MKTTGLDTDSIQWVAGMKKSELTNKMVFFSAYRATDTSTIVFETRRSDEFLSSDQISLAAFGFSADSADTPRRLAGTRRSLRLPRRLSKLDMSSVFSPFLE
jgi:hypothetical protein